MTATIVILGALLAAAVPLGLYMDAALSGRPTALDRVFGPVEGLLFRGFGIDPAAPMGWRTYGLAILATNLVLGLIAYAIFLLQGVLPLNPDGIAGLDWHLALHTAASFVTNTNQQHYSGQAQLSYFSQLAAIVTLQVVTPAVGLAALLAILRGLMGGATRGPHTDERGDRNLGNYFVDLTRSVTRVLLPLATVLALLLASQGVPSTLRGAQVVHPLDAAAQMPDQRVPVGPVAPMVAIKQLGTNGGGWYGPNSAVPLENPTPLSNALESIAILIVPLASVVMTALMTELRFGRMMFGVMGSMSAGLITIAILAERGANAAFTGLAAIGPNWEGKEVRVGIDASALWASITTQTSNGSVNAMHDSMTPIGGMVPLIGMLVNETFGGIGVGIVNFLVFVLVTAFIAGLMVGRTPEIFRRKLGLAEIRLLAVVMLVTALLILVPTALALGIDGLAANSNPGSHGISQVLYEYASATANNGSGFEGLGDATVWWNVSTSVSLILGRFVPILAPLAVAGLLAAKLPAPESAGSLSVSSPAFGVTTLAVILIMTLLTYLPALALGPVAEQIVAAPAVAATPIPEAE
ncbi:MAG: potassium-transporting ATPase subunit KdpA [Myxococcota bacterium]